jgi:hypothetical protein
MKIALKCLLLCTVASALIVAGCNSPAGPDTQDAAAQDVTITDGGTYTLGNGETYPGAEIDLSGKNLLDISKYGSVIVDAQLCDENENVITLTDGEATTSLGQFKLLKASGGWDNESNILGTKYDMVINGETTLSIGAAASGIPGVLLLQTGSPIKVKKIKVASITFKARVSDVTLSHVFGDKVIVAGNQITFNDAMYSDGAALYEFPPAVLPLTGKKAAFSVRLAAGYDSTKEHQLHIQAANGVNNFNGKNGQDGQKYITLEDTQWGGLVSGAVTFIVDGDALEAAAAVTGDANDIKGPFTLTAVRITNNGTDWNGDGTNHVREKSYTIIFESVSVMDK